MPHVSGSVNYELDEGAVRPSLAACDSIPDWYLDIRTLMTLLA